MPFVREGRKGKQLWAGGERDGSGWRDKKRKKTLRRRRQEAVADAVKGRGSQVKSRTGKWTAAKERGGDKNE